MLTISRHRQTVVLEPADLLDHLLAFRLPWDARRCDIDPPGLHQCQVCQQHADSVHPSSLLPFELFDSESFDVVLGLAVLHHMEEYELAFNALRRLGQWTFFEVCGPGDVNARAPERHEGIRKFFEGEPPIATFKSHVSDADRLWYGHSMPQFISEQTLDAAGRGCCGYATYKITADFNETNILIDRKPTKMRDEVRPYIPGMNLHNFRLLGGKAEVPKDDGLADHKPWNYIIGDGIQRIDTFHKKARKNVHKT
jgi:hypothetical protein